MKILRATLFVLLGVFLGATGHMAWLSLVHQEAHAVGILKQEPQQDPAITALYPSGFYVKSRVYLETASKDMIGRRVWAWGYLDLAYNSDAPRYPMIKNKTLGVSKAEPQ